MRIRALHALGLAALVVIAGCAASPAPGTPPSATESATVSPTASPTRTLTRTPVQTSTRTPTPRPVIRSLPSATRCSIGALPHPNRTDGLDLSAYPSPPATVTRAAVVNYTLDFEEAYFRNRIIAENADDDMNLTHVSTHASPENVSRYRDGYAVVLAVSAGTKYASGVHGDRWPTVGYFVNDTVLVRSTVDGVQSRVDPSSGTVLLRCEQ
ncbi:MAG: hypothetical protein ABEJ55_03530 [Halanaeroarchaeum sp.]